MNLRLTLRKPRVQDAHTVRVPADVWAEACVLAQKLEGLSGDVVKPSAVLVALMRDGLIRARDGIEIDDATNTIDKETR